MGRRKMGRMGYSGLQRRRAGSDVRTVYHAAEGMGRLFAIDKMAEGPFTGTHYEPFEKRRWALTRCANVISNPAARIFTKDVPTRWVKADKFPYVRPLTVLTEHFTTGPSTRCLTLSPAGTVCGNWRESWRISSASRMATVKIYSEAAAISRSQSGEVAKRIRTRKQTARISIPSVFLFTGATKAWRKKLLSPIR